MENQFQSQTAPPLKQLPNATLTLVLGIVSILGSCCYGVVGIIAGIIALIASSKSNKLLKEDPNGYSDAGNHKAGRICAMVGLGLSVLYIVFMVLYFIIYGVALASMYSL